MDIQVQELIDKIKKDGIASASEEAARIKREAQEEALRIMESARKEGEAITARGKAEAERFEQAGAAALEQASRNLVLSFKGEIQRLLDAVVLREVTSAYGEDALKAALPELLTSWAAKGGDDLALVLPEAERGKLESFFTGKLSAELKGGLELKSDRNLGAGFRIANKDGSAYYDFSAESAAELLSAYLNPRLGEILKKAVQG